MFNKNEMWKVKFVKTFSTSRTFYLVSGTISGWQWQLSPKPALDKKNALELYEGPNQINCNVVRKFLLTIPLNKMKLMFQLYNIQYGFTRPVHCNPLVQYLISAATNPM